MASPTAPRPSPPQVVIAQLNGKRSRGYAFDFSPMRDRCRIFPSATASSDQGEMVELKTLKAIFFLNEPSGEQPTAAQPSSASHGRKIEVMFSDGERMQGTTEGYSRERQGFFMIPEDPSGKILRIFVINANVKQVRWL
ncbi:MAG: hypothetical protein HY647_01650 [Acidobacteria bacterium]|nr:hypothetical protein [Acidobacteriota bacterium]